MKNLKVVLIGFLVFISSLSFAQINVAATVGIANPILDNGFGIQVGVNPSFELTEYFSLESQFSLIHINGTQLSQARNLQRYHTMHLQEGVYIF